MISLEEIQKYLPKYLSAESYTELIKELREYPYNIDKRFYWIPDDLDIIFQGDAIDNMPFVDVLNIEKGIKRRPGIILSNTCDIDPNNKRTFTSQIMYAPIINLVKYVSTLTKFKIASEKIEEHIRQIKTQKYTQILYLPQNGIFEESIVFLDRIINIPNDSFDRSTLDKKRIFSLSNYGFYILLFKLSVHFSRIQDKVDRSN